MSWEEIKHFLEERNYYLTEMEFQLFMVDTMSRIITNIDKGDYEEISVVTKDGIGWNFKVKKNL